MIAVHSIRKSTTCLRRWLLTRLMAPVLVAMLLPTLAPAGEILTLVTPTNSIDTVISEVILREAYRRLDIEVVIRKYPAERALQLANEGSVDGEVQRIDGISARYQNLIQVKPAINYIEGAVFSDEVTFAVDGWASLEPYRIGIIRGIKFAEQNTRGMNVQRAGDYRKLFGMLAQGRFDIIVSPGINGEYQIRRLGIEGVEKLQPAIMRFDLFHYLGRDRADLVPRISAVLETMRENGELAAIREHVIDVIMERATRGLGPCDQDYACF